MNEQLESILHKHHLQHYSYLFRQQGMPLLNRDFNYMTIDEQDFNHVCTHAGAFKELYATGSGLITQWYFYHSPTYHKLFMIWISGEHDGFREDIERITLNHV